MESPKTSLRTLGRAERELIRHPEDPRPAAAGGGVLIDLADTERAREWIARSLAIAPDDILTHYNAACGYSRLGDIEAALALLERTLQTRLAIGACRKWIGHDPDLNPLGGHPRFQKVVELMR